MIPLNPVLNQILNQEKGGSKLSGSDCITAAYVAFDETGHKLDIDKLQLTFQFPGNKTVLVGTKLTLADGTVADTDSQLIPIDQQHLSTAIFTALVQSLTRALDRVCSRPTVPAIDETPLESKDEDVGDDEYEDEYEDEESVITRETRDEVADTADLQQLFQQALDEEAARIAAHRTPEQPEPVLASLVCPACGFEVQGDWRYCPACATNLS